MKQPEKNDEIAEEIAEEAIEKSQEKKKEPELEEYKEMLIIKTGAYEISLGSNSRPVEFLLDMFLFLKDKVNENNKSNGKDYVN